jgi:prepilin-type N-terminal cleavage/methylation domain-containing protein
MKSQLHNTFRTSRHSAAQLLRRPAFTLVELMVVIVIVSIVASLSLAGLAVARQSSKIDATRSTIRKIDEIVMEQYDSYTSRIAGSTATDLGTIRQKMVEEMPDNWGNVYSLASSTACVTSAGRAYAKYKSASATGSYQGAECLFMIVTRSGIAPSALEDFRPAEVGDADRDGLKEFVDAWGNPIAFLRWAPGFSSPATGVSGPKYSAIQIADATNFHDSLDLATPPIDSTAFQLYPLIYSAGPDEAGNTNSGGSSGYGIYTGTASWPMSPTALQTGICIRDSTTLIGAPDPTNPTAYRDNITNHDASRR